MTYLRTVVKPERLLNTVNTCLFELYSELHLPGLYTISKDLSSLSTPHTAQQRAEANSEKLPIVCGVAWIWRSLIGQKWRIHQSKTFRYRTPQVLKPLSSTDASKNFQVCDCEQSSVSNHYVESPGTLSQCTNLCAVECRPRRKLGFDSSLENLGTGVHQDLLKRPSPKRPILLAYASVTSHDFMACFDCVSGSRSNQPSSMIFKQRAKGKRYSTWCNLHARSAVLPAICAPPRLFSVFGNTTWSNKCFCDFPCLLLS
jgi:hypothetical protein